MSCTTIRDLLSEKITKMRDELLYNVCVKSGILPTGKIIKLADLLNADDSVWGDNTSIYSTQNETIIVHFSS